MKIYHFGAEEAPVLLLLPGTCCHWKSNFGAVIPLLADSFRVLCVSYDGFDETEQTEFPTMLEETEKIEAYLKTHCGQFSEIHFWRWFYHHSGKSSNRRLLQIFPMLRYQVFEVWMHR